MAGLHKFLNPYFLISWKEIEFAKVSAQLFNLYLFGEFSFLIQFPSFLLSFFSFFPSLLLQSKALGIQT